MCVDSLDPAWSPARCFQKTALGLNLDGDWFSQEDKATFWILLLLPIEEAYFCERQNSFHPGNLKEPCMKTTSSKKLIPCPCSVILATSSFPRAPAETDIARCDQGLIVPPPLPFFFFSLPLMSTTHTSHAHVQRHRYCRLSERPAILDVRIQHMSIRFVDQNCKTTEGVVQ